MLSKQFDVEYDKSNAIIERVCEKLSDLNIQTAEECAKWGYPPLCVYEFKKACEMETDKGAFEVIYSWIYSNIGSSNTKIGCNFVFATDFVYSLRSCKNFYSSFLHNSA